jgi:heme oxygenase (biliverdin-IX-beta and delta-forming)
LTPSRKALREATASAHDRVDAAFAAFDLTDRAGYARFLMAHAEVVWPLEAALPGARVTPDWDERKRGALLREDLALLRDAGAPTPPCDRDWPATDWSDAAIAGALYVLEGSRLGGRFLARQLPPGFPHAYLNPDQPTEKWQQFLERIDGLLNDSLRLQAAHDAANAVFAAFESSARRWSEG